MTIGEVLAQARRNEGLSIADVSRQTRIRETIISDIERDDYSTCGGDFYARGHIRAIARTVGVDSRPLIDEYDAAYLPPDTIPAVDPPPGMIPADPGVSEGTRPPGTIAGSGTGEPVTSDTLDVDTPVMPSAPVRDVPPEPSAPSVPRVAFEPPASPAPPGPPGLPASSVPHSRSRGGRRRTNWTVVLGLALVAAVGVGAYLLASGGRSPSATSASSAHRASSRPSAQPTPTASSPAPARSAAPVHVLNPAKIAAFGAGGTSEGDNPELARFALDDNAATPWHSDWYTTAHFGNLQPGTGLLLDMGRTVTVTAAQIAVGDATGGDVELRIGGSPELADLAPAARSNAAGGRVRLRPTVPAHGRYVLIWFTTLPRDQAGTFQASVYGIKLQGST